MSSNTDPNHAVDAVRETARTSLAISSDAAAFPAVVSTPSVELPEPFFGRANGDDADDKKQVSFENGAAGGDDAAVVGANGEQSTSTSPTVSRSSSTRRRGASQQRGLSSVGAGHLHEPVCFPSGVDADPTAAPSANKMVLELVDGTAFQGFSFGAKGKSVSGECVFQTGQSLSRNTSLSLSWHLPSSMMNVQLAPVQRRPADIGSREAVKRHNPGTVLLQLIYTLCSVLKPSTLLTVALAELFTVAGTR